MLNCRIEPIMPHVTPILSCAVRAAPLAFLLSTPLAASDASAAGSEWRDVPISAEAFDVSAANSASFEERDGRSTLCLDGEAFLRDVTLTDGSISVDIANDRHRHFANLVFRAASRHDYETAYLRLHKSGQFDAMQYTPHLNGETNWQLFGEAQAVANFGNSPWVTLTVDFADDRARIRVGPEGGRSLVETMLTLPAQAGGIGLRTQFRGCFSNFRYTAQRPTFDPAKLSKPVEAPVGAIMRWSLSDAFRMEAWAGLSASYPAMREWDTVSAEPNGRLLVSRYRRKTDAGGDEDGRLDGVHAGVAIHSPATQSASLQIDASDMATVWLNGNVLFAYDNSFRAKGPLFRGDFNASGQTLALPLRKGRNELVVLVADRANGWGLAGAVQADETVRIEPLGNGK